jgi:hypothetical protein
MDDIHEIKVYLKPNCVVAGQAMIELPQQMIIRISMEIYRYTELCDN